MFKHQKHPSPHNPRRQPLLRLTHRRLRVTHSQYPLQMRLQHPKNNLYHQVMEKRTTLHSRSSKVMPQLRTLPHQTTQTRLQSNLQLLQSKPRLSSLLNKKRPLQSKMLRSKKIHNQSKILQLLQGLKQARMHRSKKMLRQSPRLKPRLHPMQKLPQKLLPIHLTTQQKSHPLMIRSPNLRVHQLRRSSQPIFLRMQSLTYRMRLPMNPKKLATRNLKQHHHRHLHPNLPLKLRMHPSLRSIVLWTYLLSQLLLHPLRSTRK